MDSEFKVDLGYTQRPLSQEYNTKKILGPLKVEPLKADQYIGGFVQKIQMPAVTGALATVEWTCALGRVGPGFINTKGPQTPRTGCSSQRPQDFKDKGEASTATALSILDGWRWVQPSQEHSLFE